MYCDQCHPQDLVAFIRIVVSHCHPTIAVTSQAPTLLGGQATLQLIEKGQGLHHNLTTDLLNLDPFEFC